MEQCALVYSAQSLGLSSFSSASLLTAAWAVPSTDRAPASILAKSSLSSGAILGRMLTPYWLKLVLLPPIPKRLSGSWVGQAPRRRTLLSSGSSQQVFCAKRMFFFLVESRFYGDLSAYIEMGSNNIMQGTRHANYYQKLSRPGRLRQADSWCLFWRVHAVGRAELDIQGQGSVHKIWQHILSRLLFLARTRRVWQIDNRMINGISFVPCWNTMRGINSLQYRILSKQQGVGHFWSGNKHAVASDAAVSAVSGGGELISAAIRVSLRIGRLTLVTVYHSLVWRVSFVKRCKKMQLTPRSVTAGNWGRRAAEARTKDSLRSPDKGAWAKCQINITIGG